MLKVREHRQVMLFLAARNFLGRSVYHTAAYWVDGLLIDTGCAYSAQELVAALDSLPVQLIVNTHCHEDHIGGNGPVQKAKGAPVLAHPLALPILAHPYLQYLQPYRRLFWGWPQPSRGHPVGEWVETAHHRFRVIHTPGHSPDHISLFELDEGWLFSGDAYIGGQDRAARADYDIYAVIASLKKLAALPSTCLFPGSGSIRANPAVDLRQKVAQLEELGAQVRHLHATGESIQAIKRQLLGREPLLTYLTHGHFRGRYLVQAFLAPTLTAGGTE